jgi:predicted SAM-dependent methyltransferase
MRPSISENNGLESLTDEDLVIYSVGISTGGSAEMRMAMAHPSCHIMATTIDVKGAQFANKHIEEAGLLDRIEVKIEDVSKPLCYPDEFFDFIYARLVLHYLSRKALIQTLNELHRVLKPSGRIFVVVRSSDCLEAKSEDATFDPETQMTTYSSNGNTYKRYFHTEESIQNHLIAAGFSILQVKKYEELLCIDFERLQPASQADTLIEVLASKAI